MPDLRGPSFDYRGFRGTIETKIGFDLPSRVGGGSTLTKDERSCVKIVNTETIPGYTITSVKGLVSGNTIRAKHLGRDIGAGLKNLVGGELTGYTELLTESREQAMERMIADANSKGANAIVNVRFTTSAVAGGAAELYAYGTAVVVEAT